MSEKIPDKIKVNIDRVLDLMKSDALPEVMAKVTFPKTMKPMSAWSISNKMLCYTDYIYTHHNKEMSAAKSPSERGAIFLKHLGEAIDKADYRGFRQWGDIKRFIKKGSHSSSYILAPMWRKGTRYFKFDGGEKIVYPYKPDDMSGVQSEEYKYVWGFNAIPTFEKQQTYGKEINYTELKLPQLPFKPVADHLGIKVIPVSFSGRAYGSFSPKEKVIQLATLDETTFLHELSHAVDDYLLKAKTGKGLKGGQQADQEIIAEFCSAVLASIAGLKIEQKAAYTKKYIQHYTGKKKGYEEDILYLMSRIEKILDFITNFKEAKSPTRQAEEKQGEEKSEVEKLADNPPKKTGAVVGKSSGGERVTIVESKHKSLTDESIIKDHNLKGEEAEKVRNGEVSQKNISVEELNHKIEKAYNSHPFEGGKHRFIVLQSGKRKGLLKIKANSNEANMLVMKIENLDSFQWTTIDPNLKSYKTPRYRYQYDKKNVALYVIPKEDELK